MRAIETMQNRLISAYSEKKENQLISFVDLLNYGAAAQEKLGYNQDDYANALLTDEQKQYASETPASENILQNDTAYSPGTSLNLESRIEMRIMFKWSAISEVSYAIVTHTKHDGSDPVETRVEKSEFLKYNNTYYYVPVETLVVADGDEIVTCVLYKADGTEVTTVVDSMNSYLSRAIAKDGHALYSTLLRFTRSAYTFLHTK